jgi:transposase
MEALRLGAYRAVHRASAAQRHVRAQLAVRDALVRTRTRYVNVVRALTRRDGLRLTSGGAEHLEARLAALELAPTLQAELAPLRVVLEPVNAEIERADAQLAAAVATNPLIARLCTTPQIGPVTAVAFVATLDDVTRFRTAHQVEGYLGLTPREYSSGERQQRGRISKTGSPRMRALLVEAGWRILRSRDPALAHLRAWGEQIAQRRGANIAAVALARRLAGILFALWRDGTTYHAPPGRSIIGA